MKVSSALLLAFAASAEDKKVPPRHPLQRLERLGDFTEELLSTWFNFLPSQEAWIKKFKKNGERMATNFARGGQRCGHYDEEQSPHGGPARERRDEYSIERYNREDPSIGVKQLTTGYRKWAERYLSQCSGQKKKQYQINRMNKWNEILQAHLASVQAIKPTKNPAMKPTAKPTNTETTTQQC